MVRLGFLTSGVEFFQRQIVDETLLTGVGSYGHYQPFYYFIPVTVFTICSLGASFPRPCGFLYQRRRCLAEDHLLYPLVWFVAVLFSLACGWENAESSILPLYPATALLFGAWWSLLEQGKAGGVRLTQWMGGFYALLWGSVIAAISVYLSGAFGLSDRPFVLATKRFGDLAPILYFLSRPSFAVAAALALSVVWLSLLVWFLLKKMDRCFWLPDDDSAGPNTRHKAWLLSLFRGSEDDETIHEQGNAKGRLEYPFAFLPRVRLWRSFYARRHIPSYAKNFAGLQPPISC